MPGAVSEDVSLDKQVEAQIDDFAPATPCTGLDGRKPRCGLQRGFERL